ncbi:MAG: hypothetical protein HYR85_01150 [Planctomycetes bacterium]|nr:hypothetical protein [Planctomycetota bacterium]MBI3843177.1 hypothetical protein [Planctomycetota bacterium]
MSGSNDKRTRSTVISSVLLLALTEGAIGGGSPQLEVLGSYQLQGDPNVPPAGPRENDPAGCAITTTNSSPRAWVAVRGGADIGLHVYDLASVPAGSFVSIPRPTGVVGRPTAVAASDAADAVAITYFDSVTNNGTVLVYRASDATEISRFHLYPTDTGTGVTNPAGVAILDSNILVVTDGLNRGVRGWYYRATGSHVIGDTTGSAVSAFGVPSDVLLITVTISARPTTFALVLEKQAQRIEVFPVASGRVRPPRPPLRTSDEPGGMFIVGTDPATVRLYVTQPASDRILVLRAGSPLVPISGTGVDGPSRITGVEVGGVVHLYVTSDNRACISYLTGPPNTPSFVNFAEPPDSSGGAICIACAPGLPATPGLATGHRVVVPIAWQDSLLDLGKSNN